MRRLSLFISVQSEEVLSFIFCDMILAAMEGEKKKILLFIHGVGTKPKSAILPASEEERERERNTALGSREEASLLFENKG